MNEKEHWNKIGSNYNNEIFDVFKSDKNKKLPFYFKKHAHKNNTALDFGSGNGKSFPFLSPLFKRITAIDISQQLIDQAKTRGYKNISFKQMDLAKPNIKLPKVNFVFCCNVVMLPVIEKNYMMLRNIRNALVKGGTCVIVLPALESSLFSSWRLIDLYRKEGKSVNKIPQNEFAYFNGTKREILQGLIHIDGVATKHYSALEIEVIFKNAGLSITALDKINYNWNSELSSPPKWLKEPYPWDWLVECKRLK